MPKNWQDWILYLLYCLVGIASLAAALQMCNFWALLLMTQEW